MTIIRRFNSLSGLVHALAFGLLVFFASSASAAPIDVHGKWYQSPTTAWISEGQYELQIDTLRRVTGVTLSGGHFIFQGDFTIPLNGRYVLDFKNTSIIGHFRHLVFDEQRHLVATLEGGMQYGQENPFFLRNGRELELVAGRYLLISELKSPFYLAQPVPYIDDISSYRSAIKPGNALVLVGLGVFLGLGIYYLALGIARRRLAEGMYALFILGNLLYNGSALRVFTELFDLHWMYLISFPILFSNMAYIAFVMALLEIRQETHPQLYRIGWGIIALFVLFVLGALLYPNQSLEFDRYGVGIFLLYGLLAGIIRTRQGNITARFYLIAIGLFFILGGLAITQAQLVGVYTLYIEHVGLFAVAVEVILLALVLAYQFAQLHREKELISKRLEHSKRLAHTDTLTGLPNRFIMDKELEALPQKGSLTFIDLDRLKYYNDNFGHAKGDELLCHFAQRMARLLDDKARIFRVGGDEFAITCPSGDLAWVEARMAEAIQAMHEEGFEFAGASAGSAHLYETPNMSELKHLADMRMYDQKQHKQLA